jgi:hypothetical protein
MILALDFWPWRGFGFGFTLMIREILDDDLPKHSGFEWQIKIRRWDLGTGDDREEAA